jgi:hypothetical protein
LALQVRHFNPPPRSRLSPFGKQRRGGGKWLLQGAIRGVHDFSLSAEEAE